MKAERIQGAHSTWARNKFVMGTKQSKRHKRSPGDNSIYGSRIKLKPDCRTDRGLLPSQEGGLCPYKLNNSWTSGWMLYQWYSLCVLSALFLHGVTAQDSPDRKLYFLFD